MNEADELNTILTGERSDRYSCITPNSNNVSAYIPGRIENGYQK
jgi:hypothetical protein